MINRAILLSGGLDSATVLAFLIARYRPDPLSIHPITIIYGQKHVKEVEAAMQIAEFFGTQPPFIYNLPNLFSGSALTDRDILVPIDGEYRRGIDNLVPSTYVPARNQVMLSIAASIAMMRKLQEVWIGVHYSDADPNHPEAVYPDCSREFIEAIQQATDRGTAGAVAIVAPLLGMTKTEVVQQGSLYGTPFQLTWTCYQGREKACGVCSSCRERLRAFRENGLVDPIPYERKN